MILGVALAGSAALAAFGDKASTTDAAEAVSRAARTSHLPAKRENAARAAEPSILRLMPRDALNGESDNAFKTDEKNVFASQDWTPPPPPPAPAPPPPPPAPPSAPPLPFTYIGKSIENGTWEVYLGRDDRAYVVREKSVIEDTYRVDAIAPPVLVVTYLPLNQAQQISIGVFE